MRTNEHTTDLETFIRAMPKVELHVHLEGSIRPETLLELAARNEVALPARTVAELREWYAFKDFDHFVEVYLAAAGCIRTPADVERIASDFLEGQAAQNVLHSEVTYTASTQRMLSGISLDDQLEAINRARARVERDHGVTMSLTIDYPRHLDPEEFVGVAHWAVDNMSRGVSALGLGGPEVGYPPELFERAFAVAREAGLPSVPHAGETEGPESIRGALRALDAVRIGHGVRCLEDAELVAELRDRQIPLEVCPTSNVCLGVAPSFAEHPLPRLLDAGLYVTLNSDDPPMFGTTLTDEYLEAADAFGFGKGEVRDLVVRAAEATLLPPEDRARLLERVGQGFQALSKFDSLS
ncbi:MAG: adenosine deaminase [Gemmatimonadota bacterium]